MVKNNNLLKNRITYIILLVVVSRIIMYVIFKGYEFCTGDTKGFILGLTSPWDNGWYRAIAKYGYDLEPCRHTKGDAASWAFFPLNPMCISFISKVLKISVWKAGFISNTLFFIIALIFSDKYILLTRKDERISNFFIFLMIFGPYTFYFSMLYTESLYFMLTMMTFYFMIKEKWIQMGIAGCLLSATRSTGVLIVFSIAIYYLTNKYNLKKNWIAVLKDALKDYNLVLGVSMIPMGLFAYMSYLWKLTGDSLAFVRIQKAWGRSDVSFLNLLQQFLFNEKKSYIYFVVFALFSIIIVVYAICKHHSYEIVTPAAILAIQCRSSFLCIPRYMISTGLFWIVVVELIVKHCTNRVQKFLFFSLMGISVFFLILWYQQNSFCI